MEKTGKVYKIINPQGRVYIGSTSQKIERRWSKYRTSDCKTQPKIYNSIQKYGYEAHSFVVIWEGDVTDMFRMERILGEMFNVIAEGLNCSLPGYDEVLPIISQETRNKISKTGIGRKHPPKSEEYRKMVSERHKGKKSPTSKKNIRLASEKQKVSVDMFDRNWDYVRSFSSLSEAARFIKGHAANICRSCKDGITIVKNHRFLYGEKTLIKKLKQIDPKTDDIIKSWDSITEAVNALGVSRNNISAVCRGRGITAGGFKWRYAI